MQFTKEEIKLAEPVVEAIKRIAERQEKKCPECRGLGKFPLSKERIVAAPRFTHIKCPKCNGTGKVSKAWKWEPELGQWVLWKSKPYVIYEVEENLGVDIGYKDIRIAAPYDFHYVMRKTLIPLLDWQKIEKILEGMGYLLQLRRFPSGWIPAEGFYCDVTILNEDAAQVRTLYGLVRGKSRQLAVMLALIQLRKEMEK